MQSNIMRSQNATPMSVEMTMFIEWVVNILHVINGPLLIQNMVNVLIFHVFGKKAFSCLIIIWLGSIALRRFVVEKTQ